MSLMNNFLSSADQNVVNNMGNPSASAHFTAHSANSFRARWVPYTSRTTPHGPTSGITSVWRYMIPSSCWNTGPR